MGGKGSRRQGWLGIALMFVFAGARALSVAQKQ